MRRGAFNHPALAPLVMTGIAAFLGILPLFVASLCHALVFHKGGRQVAAAFRMRIPPSRTRLFPTSRIAAQVQWRHAAVPLAIGWTIVAAGLLAFDPIR